MNTFEIGSQTVGPDEPTFVIAEAGSNHNGNLETAKKLIDVAADAGADAVKFQTFRAEDLYVDDRDLVNDPEDSTYALLESLEQPYEWIPELYEHCRSQGIQFMSSPFDERSARELAEYVPAFKVASFTLSHHPFLETLAEYDKPVIMSTGAHEKEEIEDAVAVLRESGVGDIALLHCVSSYPTPLDGINVRAVETLQREFETVVGFSDHTTEPAVAPAAAIALGGSIVEKHFTLDKEMDGPDHSFALEPDELETMINAIRQTKNVLGDGSLALSDIESGAKERSQRGIFASHNISSGETLSEDDLQILRPGPAQEQGLHPKYYDEIVGKQLKEDTQKENPITEKKIHQFSSKEL
ncbi:N-acetylneuraminate synthase family protein [Natronomonas gomsonensis]|uniref:N-acetylneuraminate synthase family protein n=1 Tax=Natronomonas gomsonensis TaxID=1046043 RepID=UPI00227BBE81|nr:N-acetylneuraminate synthase family protein [Natronomonas gomsonensis]MCY4732126.1 N-acetylneuraminate synthase family protein [Natronomonas gomsonensis]